MSTTPKRYTRFELMDTTGRVVVHCGNTQSLEQDECRTLKVFIDQPARAKDAELIQRLVDEVADRMQPNLDERFRGEQWHKSKRILDVAAAAGFKPTEP
jgi:hypothetical protein